MNKEQISIEQLIESLSACVSGDSCENCMESDNVKTRFCWVDLMRKTAEVLEDVQRQMKFYSFLWNTIQPNEMEQHLAIYRAGDKKEEA